ncbi:hypothetical protein HK098_002117 [Nowakowskiella sp. JEL0407]|nr:hypothetical protein HK098_002117 [Nowakowskiella sp. JEL0407]
MKGAFFTKRFPPTWVLKSIARNYKPDSILPVEYTPTYLPPSSPSKRLGNTVTNNILPEVIPTKTHLITTAPQNTGLLSRRNRCLLEKIGNIAGLKIKYARKPKVVDEVTRALSAGLKDVEESVTEKSVGLPVGNKDDLKKFNRRLKVAENMPKVKERLEQWRQAVFFKVDMSTQLTAANECKRAAQILSVFVDSSRGGQIPPTYVVQAFGFAILKGPQGVAVVRLHTGDWSAPCAIAFHNPNGEILSDQESVLLFMTERSVTSLIENVTFKLDGTHRFEPGPGTRGDMYNVAPVDPYVDVYVWVRYQGGYTDPRLLKTGMAGWYVGEDKARQKVWHGADVSWIDVLTNKISVDRSSVGNALYLTLRLAAGSAIPEKGKKNFAEIKKSAEAPSVANPQAATAAAASQQQLAEFQKQLIAQQEQLALQHQQELAQLQQMQNQQALGLQQSLQAYAQPNLAQLQQQAQQQALAQAQMLQLQQMSPQQQQLYLQQQQQLQLLQQQMYQQQMGGGYPGQF